MNLTSADKKYILKWAKKIKAIKYLGGMCGTCGYDNVYALDFHHEDPNEKEFQISLIGLHKKWSTIEKEIQKCTLMCRNCHIKHHFSEDYLSGDRYAIKQQIFQYKNSFVCEECGYEDLSCLSLDLHHSKNKEFGIAQEIGAHTCSSFSLTDKIIDEIDKCQIICRNCHVMKHVDLERQQRLSQYINDKVKTMKENQRLDEKQILSLRSEGLSAQKIADLLGYKRSSIEYYLFHKN